MRYTALLLLAMAGSQVSVVMAEDAAEADGPWSGNVAIGYLSATGNAENTSSSADFRVVYTVDSWRHRLKGRAYGGSTDGVTTAEAYSAGWKSTYDFNEFNYTFGALDWNKDRFAGYTRQTFATVGYGRRILNSDTFILNAEVGVGYSKQRSAEVEDPNNPGVILVPAETIDGAAGTLGGDFTWNISDTSSFEQTLYVFTASDNTFWESVSKVKASIVGNWALGLAYTVKRNSDVPPGTEKTDTLTAITLDYEF